MLWFYLLLFSFSYVKKIICSEIIDTLKKNVSFPRHENSRLGAQICVVKFPSWTIHKRRRQAFLILWPNPSPCRHFFISVRLQISMKFEPYPLQIPDVFYGWSQIAKLSRASHARASWQSGIRYMCGLRPWGPWALLRFFSRYELEKAIQKYRYALIRLDT